ncbi:MAG: hypothetical protein K940chlam3_00019 [Chlamydiae bacterium]|nr:hypothetical protein [Chlamydiota bacterium]
MSSRFMSFIISVILIFSILLPDFAFSEVGVEGYQSRRKISSQEAAELESGCHDDETYWEAESVGPVCEASSQPDESVHVNLKPRRVSVPSSPSREEVDCPYVYEEPCEPMLYEECNEPCAPCGKKFLFPIAATAAGLAIGAVEATNCHKGCDPLADQLDFVVTITLSPDESAASLGLDILFPNLSLLQALSFSSSSSGTFTQTSVSTTNFVSGDNFTVDVTAESQASNLIVSGRINGVIFDTQTVPSPNTSTNLTFTIP